MRQKRYSLNYVKISLKISTLLYSVDNIFRTWMSLMTLLLPIKVFENECSLSVSLYLERTAIFDKSLRSKFHLVLYINPFIQGDFKLKLNLVHFIQSMIFCFHFDLNGKRSHKTNSKSISQFCNMVRFFRWIKYRFNRHFRKFRMNFWVMSPALVMKISHTVLISCSSNRQPIICLSD